MADKIHAIKLILVGPTYVGKTCLLEAYTSDEPVAMDGAPTQGPAFRDKVLDLMGDQVKLLIWDTAGQERFQAMQANYYRNARIAFACFDKERIGEASKWVQNVREVEPDCPIWLVGTKSDLLSSESERREFMEMGRNERDKCEAVDFYLTSAVTREGVDELFKSAAFSAKVKRIEPQEQLVLPEADAEGTGCPC